MEISKKTMLIVIAVGVLLIIGTCFLEYKFDFIPNRVEVDGEDISFVLPRKWEDARTSSALHQIGAVITSGYTQNSKLEKIDFSYIFPGTEFTGAVMHDYELLGKTRQQALQELNDLILAECTDVKQIEENVVINDGKKKITVNTYEATYKDWPPTYKFVWIEFEGSDTFVWGKFTKLSGDSDYNYEKDWEKLYSKAKIK